MSESSAEAKRILQRSGAERGFNRFWGTLFRKYVGLFLAVVTIALISNGLFQAWLAAKEHRTALIRIQQEQADSAASKITQFIREIEGQLGWTTQLPWSAAAIEQRRFDGLRLLRQVPAITELSQLDAKGQERLRVSRLSMDVVGSMADHSQEARFKEALESKAYYGPVYFRRESEPYMTLAMSGTRRDAGVSVAEVNLKFIWDVITQIRVGKQGYAFVIDASGRLIAHPDISLVLRNTDMTRLSQIKAIREQPTFPGIDRISVATDLKGQRVLTANATAVPLGWTVFVELPVVEAYAPLYSTLQRSGLLLLGGLSLAFLAGLFLARRMMVPIQALRAGVTRIGGGDLDHRIVIRTGDELEQLADSFNDMGSRLQASYSDLESKIEVRTRELADALEQQTATAEVLRVISSSRGALAPVFQTMLENATRICDAQIGVLFRSEGDTFRAVAITGAPPAFVEQRQRNPIAKFNSGTALGRAVATRQTVQIVDIQAEEGYSHPQSGISSSAIGKLLGARSAVAVPMLKEDELLGVIIIYRQEVRKFTEKQIALVTSFAHQAVIAIENTRLLDELHKRTEDLGRSVEELRALGEVSQSVNSTLDVETVLSTIVAKAVQLSRTDAGAIYVFDPVRKEFELRATHLMPEQMIDAVRQQRIVIGQTAVGRAAEQRSPVQVVDLRDEPPNTIRDLLLASGFRALLAVPLMGAGNIVGGLVVRRRLPGEFPQQTVDLLQTFAAQSVIALQNARLFRELGEQGRQLLAASQHKSQFLANMSHELRTPLNAILGYTELIIDGIYGELPERLRQVLDRVQLNGKHLLGLINDVLDLTKIEAGQLSLTVEDYEIGEVIDSVVSTLGSLARTKQLVLGHDVAKDILLCRGDQRRIRQVVLNLVGNALKFTDKGEVLVSVRTVDQRLTVSVKDTGAGISEVDQRRIFDEFQQADSSSTKEKGGTGLGLAISKRIVELHGGTIGVTSAPGEGAIFTIDMPIRIDEKREAA